MGRLANLGVTLQRRWANVLSDSTRQVVVECFLGLRMKEHFPSISTTAESAGAQQIVPSEESEDEEAESESSQLNKDKVWILGIPGSQFPHPVLFLSVNIRRKDGHITTGRRAKIHNSNSCNLAECWAVAVELQYPIKHHRHSDNISIVQEPLSPELINQAHLVSVDSGQVGEAAPVSGELKFAPSLKDPGAFVSPAVEANSVMSHNPQDHPLI